MKTDLYGQLIFTEQDLCDLYMRDPTRTMKKTLVETAIEFNGFLSLEGLPELKTYQSPNLSVEDFDQINQDKWLMPKEYYDLDIAKWVLDQCQGEAELQRAGDELLKISRPRHVYFIKVLKVSS
jgi:hypothetical protein